MTLEFRAFFDQVTPVVTKSLTLNNLMFISFIEYIEEFEAVLKAPIMMHIVDKLVSDTPYLIWFISRPIYWPHLLYIV